MHRYKVIRQMGEGASATANLVQEKSTNNYYVMKSISLENCDEAARLRVGREVSVLHSIDHPNVVQFKTCFSYANQCHIVMERCEANLEEGIERRNGEVFSTGLLVEWFTELLCAVAHLHSKEILHRDIKSSNIFLSKRNHLKIGDFGVCKTTASEELRSGSLVGTPQYLSPEVCEGERYTEKSDIWSLGVVFYEMLCHDVPFKGGNILAVARDIMTMDPNPLPKGYDKRFSDIIFSMLQRDPKKRPSAKQLLDKFFHVPASHPSHPSQKAQHGRKIMEKFGPELVLDTPPATEHSSSDDDGGAPPQQQAAKESGRKVGAAVKPRTPGQSTPHSSPPTNNVNAAANKQQGGGGGGVLPSQRKVLGAGVAQSPLGYKAPDVPAKVSSRWDGSIKSDNTSSALNREGSFSNVTGMGSPEEHNANLSRIKNAKSKVNVAEMKLLMKEKKKRTKADEDTVHWPNSPEKDEQQPLPERKKLNSKPSPLHESPAPSRRHVDPVTPEVSPESRASLAPVERSHSSEGKANSSGAPASRDGTKPHVPPVAGASSNSNFKNGKHHFDDSPSTEERGGRGQQLGGTSLSATEQVLSLLNRRHAEGALTMDDVDDLIIELNQFKVDKFALASM